MTSNADPTRVRILLGQLGARGDCVLATPIARQIKSDFPECHLTWAVGSMCRKLVEGNPFVDEIWEVPLVNNDQMIPAWEHFRREAEARRRRGDFDEVFLTQIYPDNFHNYDGTVRASIFRGYPRPITVPVTPIIRLTAEDVREVSRFAEAHGLALYRHVVLFEFAAMSGQSFLSPEFAVAVAESLVARRDDTAVVLSSNAPSAARHPRIIDGSALPFHANAELSKYCDLLVGCSSGISWLCTSDWAKPLPKIQLLRRRTSVYASFTHDHRHFGLPMDSVLEITDCDPGSVVECVLLALSAGFPAARARFHESIPLNFHFYAEILQFAWVRSGSRAVLRSLWNTARRYGPHPGLLIALLELASKRARMFISSRIRGSQIETRRR